MQVWKEGRGTGWNKIYFTIQYETVRNGENIGIRYKINWKINSTAFFGYNIVADVWTEGNNYGRVIKGNRPNKGSGEAYFPEDGGYYWFKKGYADNNINSCRIIVHSTNGGTINIDTGEDVENGDDVTFEAPIGYAISTVESNVNFNVGEVLNIRLNNPTNLTYNHKIKLQITNDNNNWIDIEYLETQNKNVDIEYSEDLILENVKTRNDIKTRIIVDTYYGDSHIGWTVKEGDCHIKNKQPDTVNFIVTDWNNTEITSINSGYGAFRDDSNIYVKIKKLTTIPVKDYAELKKIIITAGDYTEEITPQQLIDIDSEYYTLSFIDPFYNTSNNFVELNCVDSRGNKISVRKIISVEKLVLPEIISCEVKRDNGIDTKTKLIVEGNLGTYDLYSNLGIIYMREVLLPPGSRDEYEIQKYYISESEIVINQDKGTFSYIGYIEGDLGAEGFSKGQEFDLSVRVYTNVTYYNDDVGIINLKVRNGVPLIYYSKKNNAISVGAKYDENAGGPFQIQGRNALGEIKHNSLSNIQRKLIKNANGEYEEYGEISNINISANNSSSVVLNLGEELSDTNYVVVGTFSNAVAFWSWAKFIIGAKTTTSCELIFYNNSDTQISNISINYIIRGQCK